MAIAAAAVALTIILRSDKYQAKLFSVAILSELIICNSFLIIGNEVMADDSFMYELCMCLSYYIYADYHLLMGLGYLQASLLIPIWLDSVVFKH